MLAGRETLLLRFGIAGENPWPGGKLRLGTSYIRGSREGQVNESNEIIDESSI